MTFEDRTTQPTTKKPFYKRWWFITIAVILALTLAFAAWVAIEIKHIRDVEAQMKEDCKEQVTEQAKYPGGVKFVTVEMTQGEEVEATDLRRMACSLSHDLGVCCFCWSRGFMWARWSLVAMWSLVARVFFAGRMRDGHRFRA